MVSAYSVMVPLRILRSSPNGFEASRIATKVPYWVDIGFNRLHDIGLVSCHFQSVFIWKRENGMKHIGLMHSRVNRRPIRYGMKTVSCKQNANPIWNQSDMEWKRYRVNGALVAFSYCKSYCNHEIFLMSNLPILLVLTRHREKSERYFDLSALNWNLNHSNLWSCLGAMNL